ncbi:hypothetical protein QJS10_CPA09g01387 [Acorus calamus]|uniref:Uncharacterized protein n=1 Tax=Acorus calamus TaxID=4465 RepID=A0AAV9E6H3_ACOCL|nr:hypothetical protein QJS10_CPA09g01387 [Acorus calamus]
MNLLHSTPRFNPRVRRSGGPRSPPSIRWTTARVSIRSSSLPFSPDKAKHYKELEAAVDVVQRACRLCIDVKGSLLSGDRRIIEKNDRTPVTVADFGVQALISLGGLGSCCRWRDCIGCDGVSKLEGRYISY